MTAYDDPHAYHRRWDRLTDAAVSRQADAQPLLFLADHIPVAERGEGAVAIHARLDDGTPFVALIADGPVDPSDDDCLGLLAGAVERIGSARTMSLGLVHHRRGRAHVTELDRRWQRALEDACAYYAIAPIGVLTRTESGALLPLPPSARE